MSAPVGLVEFFHQRIDLAGGDRHDDPLDGADFFFADLLLPGYAKVVLDSWSALPGHGGRQPDHRRSARVELPAVADGVVEVAVSIVLVCRQHELPFTARFSISLFYSF